MQTKDELPVAELAEMCRKESEQYLRREAGTRGYCYELFCRAIVTGDQQAWTALYAQYRQLVAIWVQGDADLLEIRVNGTWTRFWQAVMNTDFSCKFTNISRIMAFLRICARSECIDEQRREAKHQCISHLSDIESELVASTGDVTSVPVIEGLMREELFTYIDAELHDPKERLVVHLSFEIGWMPRQIAQHHPEIFHNVAEVRRIKERVVLRLSNAPQLQNWWKSITSLGK